LISPDTCELRYPGSQRPATAVVDVDDDEAKVGPFGPGSCGVRRVRARALGNPRSRRPRVLSGGQEGIKGPELLHRACACTAFSIAEAAALPRCSRNSGVAGPRWRQAATGNGWRRRSAPAQKW